METADKANKASLKPFCCPKNACNLSFRIQKNLMAHLKKHNLEEKHYTGETSSSNSLSNSLSSCSSEKFHGHPKKGEKPFECQICHQKFTQVSNLRRHERVHNGEKPYACEGCNKKFSTSSNLKQHMLVHQTKEDRNKIKCEICGNSYFYKASLNKHMRHHQSQGKIESSSERSEVEDIEEPLHKKHFIMPNNTVIPDLQLDQLSSKEAILSMLNFWESNSREYFNSKLKSEPSIAFPPVLLLPLNFLQSGGNEKQNSVSEMEELLKSEALSSKLANNHKQNKDTNSPEQYSSHAIIIPRPLRPAMANELTSATKN